ncbi:MAG: acyl-CoA carboxylase subunit epsilon [Microbacterium sp.]
MSEGVGGPASEAGGAPQDGADAVRLEILRGSATAEELAAVMTVVSEAYHRESAEAVAAPEPRPSAWQFSARALREPLRRELGWVHGDR